MEQFFAILALAILVEGIVTYFTEVRKSPILLIPIALGVSVAIAYRLDIPAVLGIKAAVPFVGEVLTGVIVARGSNYLYDIIGKLTGAQGPQAGQAKTSRR